MVENVRIILMTRSGPLRINPRYSDTSGVVLLREGLHRIGLLDSTLQQSGPPCIIRLMRGLVVLVAMASLWPTAGQAAPRTFGRLYHDGTVVRTFGVPAPLPHGGTDPLFVISGGVEGQLNITKFAQGDREYSGGDWAVYTVTWNVAPYLLPRTRLLQRLKRAAM
jgi:hypothetical protein